MYMLCYCVCLYLTMCDDNFGFNESLLSPGETRTLLSNEPKWIQESVNQYLNVESSSESSSEVYLSRLGCTCIIYHMCTYMLLKKTLSFYREVAAAQLKTQYKALIHLSSKFECMQGDFIFIIIKCLIIKLYLKEITKNLDGGYEKSGAGSDEKLILCRLNSHCRDSKSTAK